MYLFLNFYQYALMDLYLFITIIIHLNTQNVLDLASRGLFE